MAYYDLKTWKPIDAAGISAGYSGKGQADNGDPMTWWLGGGGHYENADGHSAWVDPTGTQVGYGDPNADYLKNVSGLGTASKYLTDLFGSGQYGASDAQAALDAYKASRGLQPGDQSENWWDDQNRLFAYGTGFDLLGKDTGWRSMFNPDLMASQQKSYGDYIQGQQAKGGSSEDFGDLMSVLGGVGAVLGAGALGGAFSGLGGAGAGGADLAAAFGDTGLGYGAGSASMGGAAGSAAAGSAPGWTSGQDLLGGADLNFTNMNAPATGASGGNAMDWTDFLPSGTDSGGSFLDYLPADAGPLTDVGSNLNIGDVLQGMSDVPAAAGGAAGSWLSNLKNSPTSALKSMFGLNDADAASLAGLLGKGIGGLLDYNASSNQAAALKEIADRSWNAGQPYRDRANAAMTPGFDIRSIPGLSSAMDTATETYLRKLSAQNGNPAGIGAAPSQTQAYVIGNVGLPAWQNYFNANSNAGGLSSLGAQANATASQAAQADAGTWGSLGQTARQIFGNDDPYADIGKSLLSSFGLTRPRGLG